MSPARRGRSAFVELAVTIEALGDQGDGFVRVDDRRLIVPGALPGERHRVRYDRAAGTTVTATSLDRDTSPDRVDPVCPHVAACGGCVTQHLADDAERRWKLDRVRRALERRGLDVAVVWGHRSPLASRRRIRLAVQPTRHGPVLGYRARRSGRIVAVAVCPIARPALVAVLPALAALLASLEAPPAELALTAFEAGIEVVFVGGTELALGDRERLAAAAEALDLARIARQPDTGVAAETVVERRSPWLRWPGLAVAPPPGAFLQATTEAETHLQSRVRAALEGRRRVVDLFAGIGTLAAAARAAGATIAGYERDAAAVAALAAAGVETHVRDLDRRPLTPADLRPFEAAVLDPPRAGAEAQIAMLAASDLERVVYVSCAPTTFARDAAVLVGAGYRLSEVEVVDQFRFAAEVEVIAVLDRQKAP